MEKSERPLSPHLQIYRLPLTAVLSITHRITGLLLSLGILLFVICLMAVAGGPASFSLFQLFLDSMPGRILLWGWIFAFFVHFCHGVHHLIWDTGNGLDKGDMDWSACLELISAFAMTLLLSVYVLLFG